MMATNAQLELTFEKWRTFIAHLTWITKTFTVITYKQEGQNPIELPGSIQQMDYALRMLLITALKRFSHPHLVQGVLEMFEANPVTVTEKSSV
jgi:hypothetical protein